MKAMEYALKLALIILIVCGINLLIVVVLRMNKKYREDYQPPAPHHELLRFEPMEPEGPYVETVHSFTNESSDVTVRMPDGSTRRMKFITANKETK